MKIKSLKVLANSGMKKMAATALWDNIEKFAAYSFNRSHSVEYTIISYQALWVKTYYPAEFYAASLTISNEDKLAGLVTDAQTHNIYVVPPDINISTDEFEIGYDAKREQHLLYTPFNNVLNCSGNTTAAILAAREKVGAPFRDKEHFLASVNKTRCNKRVQANLDAVGAFASIEPTQLDARHPDRLRAQKELMSGLIVEMVKSENSIKMDKFAKTKIIHMVNETRECEGCSLKGGVHPTPRLGKNAKFMVITDCPNFGEEQAMSMLEGTASNYLKTALAANGFSAKDGYFTSLVKAQKDAKQLANEQINACAGFLKREIEIVKPPIIVACGGAAIRNLVPGVKGGFAELAGQVHYSPELDANIVFGINPMMVYPDPSRQSMLNDVFKKVAELVDA